MLRQPPERLELLSSGEFITGRASALSTSKAIGTTTVRAGKSGKTSAVSTANGAGSVSLKAVSAIQKSTAPKATTTADLPPCPATPRGAGIGTTKAKLSKAKGTGAEPSKNPASTASAPKPEKDAAPLGL